MLEKFASLDTVREVFRELETMSSARARRILLDDTSPALLLYAAARVFYGPTVASYEPESLWALLDVPEHNRDKLMAALTLQVNPQFYWDIRVFGHTCLAFNGHVAHTELTPKPTPEQVATAIFEAQLLFQLDTETVPEFDDEVSAFVAACLAHEGLAYAPPILSFAEEHLERLLSPEGLKLNAAMKKIASEEHPTVDMTSALGVQFARYQHIAAYLSAHLTDIATRVNATS